MKRTPFEFVKEFNTTRGMRLAHLLGLGGKGCKRMADDIANYAWNLYTHEHHPEAMVPQFDMSKGSYRQIADSIASENPHVRQFIQAQCLTCLGHHPTGCCAQDGHGG